MTSLTSFLRGCYLPSLLRPMLPLVGDLPSPLMAIFIILNTNVPLIFHSIIQPKISSGSGVEVDLVIFAIFSNSGHLGYST